MEAFRSREYAYQNPLVRGLLLSVALMCGVLFAVGGMWADPSAATAAWWLGAATVAITLAPLGLALTITVDATRVHVSLAGVAKRNIHLEDVESIEHRTYRPMKEFGGWGWRWSLSRPNRVAYATRGETAVVLLMRDGGEVYLGVDDEAALAEALGARIGT